MKLTELFKNNAKIEKLNKIVELIKKEDLVGSYNEIIEKIGIANRCKSYIESNEFALLLMILEKHNLIKLIDESTEYATKYVYELLIDMKVKEESVKYITVYPYVIKNYGVVVQFHQTADQQLTQPGSQIFSDVVCCQWNHRSYKITF